MCSEGKTDSSVAYEVAKTMEFNFAFSGYKAAMLTMLEVRKFLKRYTR